MNVQFAFGVLAPKLGEQFAKYGITLDQKEVERFELLSRSISICKIHGLIPEAAGNRGYDRLAKMVVAAVKKAAGRPTP